MRLSTRQTVNFDITTDISLPFDHSPEIDKDFGEDCLFYKAYKWLFNQLSTDKVIWCRCDVTPPWNHGREEVIWELDVPEDEIIVCLNPDVWNAIINQINYVPDEIYDQWHEIALKETKTTKEYDKLLDSFENEYFSKINDINKYHREYLFISPDNELFHDKWSEFLIPSPVKKEWVIDSYRVSSYCLDLLENDSLRFHFLTEEELIKQENIIESYLKNRVENWEKKVTPLFDGLFNLMYEY